MACSNKPINVTLKQTRVVYATLCNIIFIRNLVIILANPGRWGWLPWRPVLGWSSSISPEIWMSLKEHHFFLGRLCQAQLVCDVLLAPAFHNHVALLETVCEVLDHIYDNFFSALVH